MLPLQIAGTCASCPAMMTPEIRPIDPADPQALACLAAYYAELDHTFPGGFDPGPTTDDGMEQLRPPLGLFLLAWDGPTPVGCVGLRGDGTSLAEVKRLWVADHARGSGLARALMEQVESHARHMQVTRLVLDTSRHLPKAVAFYRRQGWTEIARYNDNPYAHHFFEKRL
jgi:GNAT superfamily N-acetyltransferase